MRHKSQGASWATLQTAKHVATNWQERRLKLKKDVTCLSPIRRQVIIPTKLRLPR